VLSTSGSDGYTVTQIQLLSEKNDKTVLLILASSGDRLIATRERSFEKQTSYSEIRDERSGEFLRVSLTFSYPTRTRSSTLELAHKNPQLQASELPFEITGPGNSKLSGIEAHWRDPGTARGWRTRIRQMVSSTFLEELEIVDSSGLFSEPILFGLHEVLMQFILYRTSCDSTVALRVDPAIPDCGFDKDFGFPCSEQEQKRAAAAMEAKTGQRY
jgi:hypothetical protein